MNIDTEALEKIRSELGQFEVGRVIGGDNRHYLRFGYWKQVDIDSLSEILRPLIVVEENSDFDDDCGWKYSYHLYSKIEWDILNNKKESLWCHYSGMPSPESYKK